MTEAEVRARLRDITAKAFAHLKEADAYLTALEDLLREESVTIAPHLQFRELWNTATKGTPLAACLTLSPARITKIKARLAERPLKEWGVIFARIVASDFCCGGGKDGWRASFLWIVKNDENATKVLEGTYDNRQANGRRPAPDAAETWGLIRDALAERLDPQQFARYIAPLAPAGERSGGVFMVLAPTEAFRDAIPLHIETALAAVLRGARGRTLQFMWGSAPAEPDP